MVKRPRQLVIYLVPGTVQSPFKSIRIYTFVLPFLTLNTQILFATHFLELLQTTYNDNTPVATAADESWSTFSAFNWGKKKKEKIPLRPLKPSEGGRPTDKEILDEAIKSHHKNHVNPKELQFLHFCHH